MADLSPAAQAVLDATWEHWPGRFNSLNKRLLVAAALRAAVAATQMRYTWGNSDIEYGYCDTDKLLAIATELESHQ